MKYISEIVRNKQFVFSNTFALNSQVRFQHTLTEVKPSSFGRIGVSMVSTNEDNYLELNDGSSGKMLKIRAENYRFSEIEMQAGEEEEYIEPAMNVINPFK